MPDSLPIAGADSDWREFRARLILSSGANKATAQEPGTSGRPSVDDGHWAHPIPGPEQGCLLIAHPLMFIQQQTYFAQVDGLANAPVKLRNASVKQSSYG